MHRHNKHPQYVIDSASSNVSSPCVQVKKTHRQTTDLIYSLPDPCSCTWPPPLYIFTLSSNTGEPQQLSNPMRPAPGIAAPMEWLMVLRISGFSASTKVSV